MQALVEITTNATRVRKKQKEGNEEQLAIMPYTKHIMHLHVYNATYMYKTCTCTFTCIYTQIQKWRAEKNYWPHTSTCTYISYTCTQLCKGVARI